MANLQPVDFAACLTPVDSPMLQHIVTVPRYVSEQFVQKKGAIRVLCSIDKQPEFPCALNPRGDEYMIIFSKNLIRQHRLQLNKPFTLSIRIDENDGMQLPEELAEVLLQDEYASQLFDELLPGHKRGLIYYIRTAKTTDTRIKRALYIAEKIKSGELSVQKKDQS